MNKKKFWFCIVLGAIIFAGGPFLVQYTNIISGSSGNGDWLSFWGSYLGVIPSGLIAYAVARYQIDNEKIRQKEQFNHTKHIDNLTAISKKLRKLDSVFEYGTSHQYLFKNKSEAKKYFEESDGQDLEDMMDIVVKHMHDSKIFENLTALLLDIDMMPKVRDTEVYIRINELNNKMDDLSSWFSYIDSGSVPSGEGEIAYIKMIDKYTSCYDSYHRALKQIADEVYAT